ncbi:MAG TPA: polysaccharide deacetylase family protein [Solirubrobacterales bacterium]|nr:polysaccharide deacetylase family protein [Solirubrobacterales bacterium]
MGDEKDRQELDAHASERARRREEQRRRTRRQRLLAASALAVVVGAIAVVILSLGGGGASRATNAASAAPQQSGSAQQNEHSSSKVRNATPQPGWKPYAGPVPILEYHVLGRPMTEVPYPDLYVPRASFRKQMDWLDRQGYEAVTLEQVEEAWYHGGTLPRKPVVLSFDDGYRPQYTFALPTLRKHGWPGVLNLKAEGSDLYESNVNAMLDAGWELAAHTINHSDLTTLEGAALEEEVAGSRKILQREYGVPVKNFCYPAGRFDETVIAAVEAAGYAGATTEIPGFATRKHPYELARIEVLGSWDVEELANTMHADAEAAGVEG